MSTLSTTILAALITMTACVVEAQKYPPPPTRTPTGNPTVTASADQQVVVLNDADRYKLALRAIQMVNGWQTEKLQALLGEQGKSFDRLPQHSVVRGLLEAQLGRIEEGLKILSAAAVKAPLDPEPKYYTGEILYWQRRFDEAGIAWEDAARRARVAVEKFEDAAAVQTTPTVSPGVMRRLTPTPPAQAGCEGVSARTDHDPVWARNEFYLGASLNRSKDYGSARRYLEQSIDRGFNSVLATYQIGLGFLFEQKFQAAREAFDTVVELDPRFAPAYYYRGMAWDKLGRKDNVLIDMDAFLSLAPNAPEAGRARSVLAASRR